MTPMSHAENKCGVVILTFFLVLRFVSPVGDQYSPKGGLSCPFGKPGVGEACNSSTGKVWG